MHNNVAHHIIPELTEVDCLPLSWLPKDHVRETLPQPCRVTLNRVSLHSYLEQHGFGKTLSLCI